MNEKKYTVLSGILTRPLCIGSHAYILYKGGCIRTSRVVAIHSVDAREIRFETMNTHYRLVPVTVPQAADYTCVQNAAA